MRCTEHQINEKVGKSQSPMLVHSLISLTSRVGRSRLSASATVPRTVPRGVCVAVSVSSSAWFSRSLSSLRRRKRAWRASSRCSCSCARPCCAAQLFQPDPTCHGKRRREVGKSQSTRTASTTEAAGSPACGAPSPAGGSACTRRPTPTWRSRRPSAPAACSPAAARADEINRNVGESQPLIRFVS
jgi:hypothetical protein